MLASTRVPQVRSVPSGRNQNVTVPAESYIARLALMSPQRMEQSSGERVPHVNQSVLTRCREGGVARVPGHLPQTRSVRQHPERRAGTGIENRDPLVPEGGDRQLLAGRIIAHAEGSKRRGERIHLL